YSFELLRNDLVRAVGVDRMKQLMPLYAKHGLNILSDGGDAGEAGQAGGAGKAGQAGEAFVAHQSYLSFLPIPPGQPFQPFPPQDGLGSNNWVVDGTMTASGKPMLANDPHLGSRIPSTWYLAHVTAADFEIIGATLPGAP